MPATILLLVAALGATPAKQACTPIKFANATPPKYPPSAVAEKLEGIVMLRMLVGTDGKAKEIAIDRSSGHTVLDQSAAAAAADWTFNPMVCDGKPGDAWTVVPFRFSLDDLPEDTAGAPAAPPNTAASPAPAARAAVSPLRQTPHAVEQDTEAMGFATVADGERALAQMGLEKYESHGITFLSGARDPSRNWMIYRPAGIRGKAIVRLRSSYESGRAVHRYAVLCEGADTWCRQLREDTEAQLRTDPPPMPPPTPSR